MNPIITKRCSPIEEAIYQDGFQAGAASRDAEVARLKPVPMRYRRMAFNAQLQDEVARLEQENDQLRAQFRELLATTTEQSLAEYRNKVIEAFVNEFSRHVGGDGEFWLHELQDFAMKEQP